MSDLNSLIIFAHVVDANGFSKAARRLKMPTSTVSRRIAELEQALGVRLIERSTRSPASDRRRFGGAGICPSRRRDQ